MDNNKKNTVKDYVLSTMIDSHAVWLSNHGKPVVPFNLENSELVGVRIKDKNLTKAKFVNSHLNDVDFSGCKMYHCMFKDCKLENVLFKDCKLEGAEFNNVDFAGNFVAFSGNTTLEGAKFINTDICDAQILEDIYFGFADFGDNVTLYKFCNVVKGRHFIYCPEKDKAAGLFCYEFYPFNEWVKQYQRYYRNERQLKVIINIVEGIRKAHEK